MKIIQLSLLLLAALSAPAFAGVDSSGGGRGVVCRDSRGRIKSAELLDLWEARQIYRRVIVPSRRPVKEQVEQALGRLQNLFYYDSFNADGTKSPSGEMLLSDLRPRTEIFLKPSEILVPLRGTKLNDTLDSEEPAVPANCLVEQIVNFMDSSTKPIVLVNEDIYQKLSPTNQAALIVHEALYGFLRGYGEKNSVRARRVVGHVFAGGDFPSRDAELAGRGIVCMTEKSPVTAIHIYQKANGKLGLIQTNDRNLIMLGLYNAPAESEEMLSHDFENNPDFIFSAESCKHLPNDNENFRFYRMPGQGPADFQRESILAARCVNGKAHLEVGGSGFMSGTLQCRPAHQD